VYDAYAAVRDVVAVVLPTLGRQVRVELDLVGNGWIRCVAEEFNQVLTNLIQNALEAVVADGSGRVSIRGKNEGVDLLLSVRDNGPGIPEANRARIFDAFYTTKEVGRGMGMGLTITRRVVVAMGGNMSVKSQLGVGTEFVVRVPGAASSNSASSNAALLETAG
jgi:signal transduction histidine kinase